MAEVNKIVDTLLTLREAATRLSLSERTVRRRAKEDKEFPARKVGRVWRFDSAELEAWIKRQ